MVQLSCPETGLRSSNFTLFNALPKESSSNSQKKHREQIRKKNNVIEKM